MFEIKIIEQAISITELKAMAEVQFGTLVKAVVDIEKKIMSVGGEMHADEEAFMLERGSEQENLWGINIYPEQPLENRIEFDSMINIRPYLGNRSRGVEKPETQKQILAVTNILIKE